MSASFSQVSVFRSYAAVATLSYKMTANINIEQRNIPAKKSSMSRVPRVNITVKGKM
jgi:hypothetical protein